MVDVGDVAEDEVWVVVGDDDETAVGVLVDADGGELDELVDVEVELVGTGGGDDGGVLDGVDVEELVGNDEDGGVLDDVAVGLLLDELALCIILIALLRN